MLDRLFGRLLGALNSVASLWVLCLIGLICADVFGRALFNRPIVGVPEIVKLSIVGMVWAQMPYTLRIGGHLRTEILLGAMGPATRAYVIICNALVGIAFFGFVAWLASDKLIDAWEFGEFEGESPMRVPTWPIWALLVVGAALTAVQYCVMAWRVALHGASAEHAPFRRDV